MAEIVHVKDLDLKPKHLRDVKELVAVAPPREANDAGIWICYVCGTSRYAVVHLAEDDNWYVCAQCLFNGVREGYFRIVHQGQQDEVVEPFVPPEKPVFHEDGTHEIDGIKVAWE